MNFFIFFSFLHCPTTKQENPIFHNQKNCEKKTLRLYQNQVPAITEILSKISQELEQKEKKAE